MVEYGQEIKYEELIDAYYEEGGEVEAFFIMILEEYANSMGLGAKFKEIMKQQQN